MLYDDTINVMFFVLMVLIILRGLKCLIKTIKTENITHKHVMMS